MGTRETTQLDRNNGSIYGDQLPPARISSRDAATETPVPATGVFDWRASDWLPPVDVLRPGFQTPEEILENRFPTPVDRQNRVQVDELIEMVKATVDPAYFWPGKVDLHHVQWPFDWYQWFDAVQTDSHGAGMHYRELPPNKIMVPRNFHIWLHRVALPPTMPRLKVMRQTIEEWNAQVKFHEEVS